VTKYVIKRAFNTYFN